MSTRAYLAISIISISAILISTSIVSAENFTLSNEGLMILHPGTRSQPMRASVVAKKDIPGRGVEFEIYFPSSNPGDYFIEMMCSRYCDPNDPIIGTKVGKFDNFELKFTLVSINGKTTEDAGGALVVGSLIGCDTASGGYRPEVVGFGEHQETNAVSSTSSKGDVVSEIGFTTHILDKSNWNPNGSTIKLLIEPVSGDIAIPEKPQRERNPAEGRYIYVDSNAAETGDGTSWTNAFRNLQDAIAIASKGDQICVAQGIYKPDRGKKNIPLKTSETFMLKTGVALYGGFPSGGGKWEDGNPAIYQTILSGDLKGNDMGVKTPKELSNNPSRSDNSIHIVTASGTDETAVLDGFIITGGNTQSGERGYSGDETIQGGGLYCKSGNATITNCIFKLNSATFGGGAYFWKGNPKLTNCKFTDNFAEDSGAGIGLSGSNPTIINCVFTKNSAIEKGGAIYNESNKVKIINCTITKNYAYAGGGVYNQKSTPTLANCIIWGNTSRYGADEPAQLYGVKIEASNCCIQGLTPELSGKNCLSADPRIADNDTESYHLSAGSPCIDAGDNKAIPENIGTDIDNYPRIAGTAVDIGAVEAR